MTNKTSNKRFFIGRIDLIIFLLLFSLGGIFLINQGVGKKTNIQNRAEIVSPVPQKVKITNINPNGFTVTWLTEEKAYGAIVYGKVKEIVENKDTLQPKKEDERESGSNYYTHSVRIDSLNPGTRYFFKIISGEKPFLKSISDSWQDSGFAEEINLPSETTFSFSYSLSPDNSPGAFSKEAASFSSCQSGQANQISSCFRPNPIFGQVVNPDGSNTNEGLVFLEIPGKSNLLSAAADEQGKWTLDLANLSKRDLSGPLGYQPGIDLLKISATAGINNLAISYLTIPSVIQKSPDITNPVILTLTNFATPIPTATMTLQPSSTPTPNVTSTPTPTPSLSFQGTLDFTVKLPISTEVNKKDALIRLYQNNKLVSTQKITLTPKDNLYQGRILINPGEYTLMVKPTGFLWKKLGTIFFEKGENSQDFSQFSFIAGDLNDDNQIDILDLGVFFALASKINSNAADFNFDGQVNTLDLSTLISNYFQTGDQP